MSKRLILILALAFVVSITAYAYAEVQNMKVGGDITVKGIARQNFKLDKDSDDQSGYMTTTKVKIAADLTDNVSAVVVFANERDWGRSASYDPISGSPYTGGDFDVWLSYVTLKEFLYSPLTLTIGKQVLRLGNRFVLSDSNTNIAGKPVYFTDLSESGGSFDAIKAILDYDPLTLTLMTAKLAENVVADTDDKDLYAVNAAYAFERALAEAYLVTKYQRDNASGGTAQDEIYTWGLRGAGDVNDNLNLQAEVAFQTGEYKAVGYSSVDHDAMAVQVSGTYKFDTTYSPMLSLGYTYLSGDKNPTTGDIKYWDPMFEAQGGGTIYNGLLDATNCHLISVTGSMKPADDITLKLSYANLQLDKKLTATSQQLASLGLGSSAPYYTMTTKKDIGDEIDLELVYDYTEDVKFSLLGGFFFPGDAFDNINDKTATQVVGKMQVTF